jgi:hypothetical protein
VYLIQIILREGPVLPNFKIVGHRNSAILNNLSKILPNQLKISNTVNFVPSAQSPSAGLGPSDQRSDQRSNTTQIAPIAGGELTELPKIRGRKAIKIFFALPNQDINSYFEWPKEIKEEINSLLKIGFELKSIFGCIYDHGFIPGARASRSNLKNYSNRSNVLISEEILNNFKKYIDTIELDLPKRLGAEEVDV